MKPAKQLTYSQTRWLRCFSWSTSSSAAVRRGVAASACFLQVAATRQSAPGPASRLMSSVAAYDTSSASPGSSWRRQSGDFETHLKCGNPHYCNNFTLDILYSKARRHLLPPSALQLEPHLAIQRPKAYCPMGAPPPPCITHAPSSVRTMIILQVHILPD